MDFESSPYREVVPEYLRERFDPRMKSNAELSTILYNHNIIARRRATKHELIQLFEDNIKRNRKVLIHEILKKNTRDTSSKSLLGYMQSTDINSRTQTTDKLSFLRGNAYRGYIKPEPTFEYERSDNLSNCLSEHQNDVALSNLGISEPAYDNPDPFYVEQLSDEFLEYNKNNTPDIKNTFKVNEMSPKITILENTLGPVFKDDQKVNNVNTFSDSTEYSDSDTLNSLVHNAKNKSIKDTILSKMSLIMPWDSVSHAKKNSSCSRCISGSHSQIHKRFNKTKLFFVIVMPMLLLNLVLLHDYYKSYNYCKMGVTPTVNINYSGFNYYNKILNQCRACPPNSVCIDRKVLLCNKRDYILSKPYISRIISPRLLPFFISNPVCKEDPNAIKDRFFNRKQTANIALITESIIRNWLGQVECNSVPNIDLINDIKKSNNNKITGLPYSLALEMTRDMVLDMNWPIERFEKSWKELITYLIEPPIENTREKVFDRLSFVVSKDNSFRFISTTKKPILPIKCRIKKALWSLLREHFMALTLIVCLTTCAWFLYDNYYTSWYHAKVIASIAESIINSHATGKPHAVYSIPELEQIYLPKIIPGSELMRFNRKNIDDHRTGLPQWIFCNNEEREFLWSHVCAQVNKNPCMREVLVNTDGECRPQWKWIGNLHEVVKKLQ